MSSGGQGNGVPCKDEGGAQRLSSKKLHVSRISITIDRDIFAGELFLS